MGQQYPLVEAMLELRWGETAPNQFSYNSFSKDDFLENFISVSEKYGYVHSERLTSRDDMFPFQVIQRQRISANRWPCLQAGLGVFTVNQVADGYSRNAFLKSIEEAIHIWIEAMGSEASRISDTLTIILRYQNAFYDDTNQNEIERLNDYFGINIQFPTEFTKKNHNFTNIELNFGIKCDLPINSMANISIQNAIIQGTKGILTDSVVFTKLENLKTENSSLESTIRTWINEAHSFHKQNYIDLME